MPACINIKGTWDWVTSRVPFFHGASNTMKGRRWRKYHNSNKKPIPLVRWSRWLWRRLRYREACAWHKHAGRKLVYSVALEDWACKECATAAKEQEVAIQTYGERSTAARAAQWELQKLYNQKLD